MSFAQPRLREVHETERKRLIRELRRLKLAAADMRLAADAAELLVDDEYVPAPRIIETGVLVAYARSFTSSGGGWVRFKEQWTPTDPDELAIHESILKRRDRRHAHTDETGSGRDIVDVFGDGMYSEEWEQLTADSLRKIAGLARAQEQRFDAAAQEIEYTLGRPRDAGSGELSESSRTDLQS
jgi:hypothetical protein